MAVDKIVLLSRKLNQINNMQRIKPSEESLKIKTKRRKASGCI